jgi:hypothetical protein
VDHTCVHNVYPDFEDDENFDEEQMSALNNLTNNQLIVLGLLCKIMWSRVHKHYGQKNGVAICAAVVDACF